MGELLITKGANINAENIIYPIIELFFIINGIFDGKKNFNHNNKTPLHYAVEYNSKEIVELLLSKGAIFEEEDLKY